MDVTCDRCKAEYEFDEALLGERGTTVKCSACGHVFRVLPPSRDAVRSQLQLRYASNGSLRPLSSLRDLQQRIRAGEVSLDDELGREGFPFRALRDVPELKNFFLSQPGRNNADRNALPPEASVMAPFPVRRDPPTTHMPVAPESMAPGPDGLEELSSSGLESDQPDAEEMSTVPPPLPGTPEREAQDAARARRAAESRALSERAVHEQRAVNKTLPAPAGIPPEQRPRNFSRGTMSGVGPDEFQLPPPPRMPQFSPKSAAPPAVAKPVSPANTPSGGSANPHASKLPPPGSGTVAGLPALKPHQTLHGAPLPGAPASGMAPGSTHPLANRALNGRSEPPVQRPPSGETRRPPSGETAAAAPAPVERPRVPPVEDVELPKPMLDPERFPQFKAVPSPLPPAPVAGGRQLYLDSKEPPPPRATESSRGWLYVALLLLVAGAGGWWFGMTRLPVLGKAVEDNTSANEAAPGSTAAPEEPLALDPAAADADLAVAPSEPPTTGAPFAPPIPDISEELARRGGEPAPEREPSPAPEPVKTAQMAKPEAKPAAKPEPKAEPKPEPAPKAAKPAQPEPAPKATAKPEKLDKLARAERALAANPSDYGAQLNRADALFSRGDYAAAQDAYKQALGVRPTGSEANAGMGFSLLQGGKASESLPYFDRAASSGYAEANIGLGDAYRALGQPSSAKEAYQAYLDRLPGGARSEYAHNQLDKLSGRTAAPKPAEPGAAPEAYKPAGELNP